MRGARPPAALRAALAAALAALAGLALVGCGHPEDWRVAAAYDLSSIRIDPATGDQGPETSLGRILPPAGSSYLWWSSSEAAGAVSDGVALLRFGSCGRDGSRGGDFYDEGDYLELAVSSSATGDLVASAPGSGARSLSRGERVLVATEGGDYAVGATGALEPAAYSRDRGGWAAASTWKDGPREGLACAFALGSRPTLSLFRDGSRLDLDDFEAFAGSCLGLEGGASFIAPFFSYDLDPVTGRTLKTLSILRLDAGAAAAAGAATLLGSFAVDSPAGFGCLDASASGVYRSSGGYLILQGLDGAELRRSALTYAEGAAQALAGPLAGSGILFAPAPAADSRWTYDDGSAAERSLSYRGADLAAAWEAELPETGALVVAAMRLADEIVVLRARAVSPTVVQHYVEAYF